MRINLPVVEKEYVLRDGVSLVSKTDTKGRITYFNPAFAEASGFNQEELLGKPHNLVRHPDMPAEAFADMWRTLREGLPWTGVVKNRRKNGEYYWVYANVTPIRERDQIVGYLSVRNKPSRVQIDSMSSTYRRIKAGQAGNLAISRGNIVRTGWMSRVASICRVGLNNRITLGMSFLIALNAASGYMAMSATWAGIDSMWLAVASITGMVVACTLWRDLHASVIKPLRVLTDSMRTLAGGDMTLDIKLDGRDEIGQLQRALQQMNVNLRSVISDVRNNVDAINVATHQIAAGNMDLAGRTESQASSLEQTASSIEEFASTVQQNAENAHQANQISLSASGIAEKGGAVVAAVGATMEEINASAKRIIDIISLIDGIAFQTNILALNAAVEAARAGEQGKGFAVVATEVRSLAQRSASAAKEIKVLIDTSAEKVTNGNRLVSLAMTTMDDIVHAVQQVNSIMNDIAVASREQSNGIAQVNLAVSHMDQVTQLNAALVEQSAATAISLEEQTQQVMKSISVFKTGNGVPDYGEVRLEPHHPTQAFPQLKAA